MIKKILSGLSLLLLIALYDKAYATALLTADNTVVLYGEVNGVSSAKVINDLVNNKSPIIYLYINSPGGSVLDGFKVINYLRHTKKNIHCIAEYAASMAHGILQACPVRLGTETNILMQHKPSMQAAGSPSEIEGQLNILKALEDSMADLESKRIGISKDEYNRRTFLPWFTAGKESVKQNVIDALVDVDCAEELYAKVSTKLIRTMFGEVEIKQSACPLVPISIKAPD